MEQCQPEHAAENSSAAAGFRRIRDVREQLREAKAALGSREYSWYPYDSLVAIEMLLPLVRRIEHLILPSSAALPVLDVGAGDGSVSFFFEQCGFGVDAIDYPWTNHNHMRGIYDLAAALTSKITIHESDIDSLFTLPHKNYSMALCLGVLYHLKNPYLFLETLARHSSFCLLTTRIAKASPATGASFAREPVAYLLDERELNNDWTNYWIFSEAGLRRLFKRTGWEVVGYLTAGCNDPSDTVPSNRDERFLCLLRNRAIGTDPTVMLLEGWHEIEPGGWRWTERRFSVLSSCPRGRATLWITLKFFVPDSVVSALGPVTLQAEANGYQLGSETYETAGSHVYTKPLPREGLLENAVRIDFTLDKAIQPSTGDARELGVLILFQDLEDNRPILVDTTGAE